jgi:Na+-driven multidrug efflux pump
MYLMLPLLVISTIVLIYSGSRWGTIGMARANIAIYAMYTLMVTVFVIRTKLISPGIFTLKASDRMYVRWIVTTSLTRLRRMVGVGARQG